MAAHHCPGFPCPICYPSYSYPPHYPAYPGYYSAPTPKGCVCPAGAELTCQGFGCPRKGIGGNNVTCSAGVREVLNEAFDFLGGVDGASEIRHRILVASGIEAPSGVETGNTDSTEGKSPTGEAGDAQGPSQ